MNIRKTLSVVVSSTLLTSFLLAPIFGQSAHAWDGTAAGRVGDIFVSGKGGVYFNLEGSPALCASGGTDNTIGLIYVPQQTDPEQVDREGGKAMLALVTSAKLSGKTVTVFANNGTIWGCNVGAIEIN